VRNNAWRSCRVAALRARRASGVPAAVERRVMLKELAILAERLAAIAAELQAFGEK